MAGEERLGANWSIDITDLQAGLTKANRMIRESESEFKAAAAGDHQFCLYELLGVPGDFRRDNL